MKDSLGAKRLFDHFSSDKKCIQYFIFIYLFKDFEGINVA